MDRIRISTRSEAAAARLVSALGEFRAEVADGPEGGYEVQVFPSAETSQRLLGLFEALGGWCRTEDLASIDLHLADRSFSLVAPVAGRPADPTQFLLERTIQLQTALESRVVIEQAKGVIAERLGLSIDAAFTLLRDKARSSRRKIHEVASEIVAERASGALLEPKVEGPATPRSTVPGMPDADA